MFAHAPAGYLALEATKKIWNKKKFNKKQTLILYILGIVFAVFPDFDLFYHYFYSAEIPHRQYISHGILIYFSLFLIFYLIGLIFKKEFIKSIGIVILIGSLSHLILDMIASGIGVLTPFSSYMFGIRKFDFIQNSFVGANMFLVNYVLELFLIILSVGVFLSYFIKQKKQRIIMWLIGFLIFIVGFSGLNYVNARIYNGGHFDSYFEDFDHDEIINLNDFDIDNDKYDNIYDIDANGNGLNNQEEIKRALNLMKGKWYDFSEAGFGEVFSRWGFLTNSDVVRKSYEAAGIYLEKEFARDYKNNPNDYIGVPEDPLFDRRAENIYAFCLHNPDRIFLDQNDLKVGDVMFLDPPSSSDSHLRFRFGGQAGGQRNSLVGMTSFIDNSGERRIMIGEKGKMVYEEDLDVLSEKFGGIKAYCRIVE